MKNLYETLGVSNEATQEEIRDAYKNKAKELHPDKGGEAQDMADVNNAYAVLRNPVKRDKYDRTGNVEETPFEVKFEGLVQNIFMQLVENSLNIDTSDLMGDFKEMVKEIIKGNKKSRKETEKRIGKLEKVIGRLSSNQDDKISRVVRNNLENCKRELNVIDEQISFMEQSLEVIAYHNYNFDVPKPEEEMVWFRDLSGNKRFTI